jgi:nitrate reductase alpha subunit
VVEHGDPSAEPRIPAAFLEWTWDRVVRSTHFLNCWYQSHCAWDVYVKDGVVFREEQAGEYPQTRGSTPSTTT